MSVQAANLVHLIVICHITAINLPDKLQIAAETAFQC